MIIPFELTPQNDYGDLMTLKEFVRNCMSGGFIDYDGFGHLATETEESNMGIHPSDVVRRDGITGDAFEVPYVVPPGITHVVWYNR